MPALIDNAAKVGHNGFNNHEKGNAYRTSVWIPSAGARIPRSPCQRSPFMEFRDEIRAAVKDIAAMPLMPPEAPPHIDLYMEQVISFLQEQTAAISRYRCDKALTKTMINNYTKAGILPRPVKKKYCRAHIYRLNYIYLFKQLLTIQDIGTFFSIPEDEESICGLYESFVALIDDYRDYYAQSVMRRLDRVEAHVRQHNITGFRPTLMLFISLMSLEAVVGQMVCQRLLSAVREGGFDDQLRADSHKEVSHDQDPFPQN